MHDLRCEHSTSDAKRCRCTDCHGSKHGIQAPIRDEHSPALRQAIDQMQAAGRTLELIKDSWAKHFGGAA